MYIQSYNNENYMVFMNKDNNGKISTHKIKCSKSAGIINKVDNNLLCRYCFSSDFDKQGHCTSCGASRGF